MFCPKKTVVTSTFALFCVLTNSSQAAVYEYSGNTVGAPKVALDFKGSATPYSAIEILAPVLGIYSFFSTGTFDMYTVLYFGPFDISNPTSNILINNDDLGSHLSSGFDFQLEAGKKYTFLNTGYQRGDVGDFTTTITGPATVIPVLAAVPETETYALLLAGIGTLCAVARRHRGLPGRVGGGLRGRKSGSSPA